MDEEKTELLRQIEECRRQVANLEARNAFLESQMAQQEPVHQHLPGPLPATPAPPMPPVPSTPAPGSQPQNPHVGTGPTTTAPLPPTTPEPTTAAAPEVISQDYVVSLLVNAILLSINEA